MSSEFNISRRKFLGAAAGAAGMAALGPFAARRASAAGNAVGERIVPPGKLSVQQFSIRDASTRRSIVNSRANGLTPAMGYLGGPDFPNDPADLGPLVELPGGFDEVFEFLAAAGYRGFEFFQYSRNVNELGRQPTIAEIRTSLDNAELSSTGTHTGGLSMVAAFVAPAGAMAHGDPSSHYLETDQVYPGFANRPSQQVELQLAGLLEAARRTGYPIKVGIVGSPDDLTEDPAVFETPQRYAEFVSAALGPVKAPVLIATLNGLGIAGAHELDGRCKRSGAATPGSSSAALAARPPRPVTSSHRRRCLPSGGSPRPAGTRCPSTSRPRGCSRRSTRTLPARGSAHGCPPCSSPVCFSPPGSGSRSAIAPRGAAHEPRRPDHHPHRPPEVSPRPNIGPMERVVVLIIALVILGPKRLPAAGRSLGQGMREFKDSITGATKLDEPRSIEAPGVAERA